MSSSICFMAGYRSPVRMSGWVLAIGLMIGSQAAAWERPDLDAGWEALVETPFRVGGDLAGATGLLAAPAIALVGDALALLDATWVPEGPLHGWVSSPVYRLALAISWTGTGVLEGLRGEDIERFPEDPATYWTASAGVGRLGTCLAGVGAVRLAVRDALSGPTRVLLSLTGFRARAGRVKRAAEEARTRLLGPLPVAQERSLDSLGESPSERE
ncbi:MAG: hypothetical protein V3T14_07265 [Myxococcota bacterium]